VIAEKGIEGGDTALTANITKYIHRAEIGRCKETTGGNKDAAFAPLQGHKVLGVRLGAQPGKKGRESAGGGGVHLPL